MAQFGVEIAHIFGRNHNLAALRLARDHALALSIRRSQLHENHVLTKAVTLNGVL